MASNDIFDVCIIGGGIVGASIAYHLTKNGKKVLLFDRKDKGRATSAGAGIISPPTTYTDNEILYKFQLEAGKYYPVLNNELTLEHELSTSFQTHPKVVLSLDEDEVSEYEAISARILERRRKENYPSESVLCTLNQEELRSRFRNIRFTEFAQTALINENGAKINGDIFTNAMLRAAENLGLIIKSNSIEILVEETIASENDEIRKIVSITDGETTWKANQYVIAGGFWTKKLVKQLGINLPLEPQRGQIIHLYHPNLDTSNIPMITAFRGHYIVPWDDGNLVCGATRESEEIDPSATVSGVQEILSEAVRIIPELSEAAIIEVKVGIRPVSKTGLPLIGLVPKFSNLFVSTGHGPLGLTLGPYSGKLLSQLILSEEPEFDLSPFQVKL
ncbi:MAG: FAD-binding oxidoreductase [Candidatus Heimdallarchaeota archaeon]|nr:FAD-binding oxidoreductase [Candidatus Heimdallarchaeota archaeon]